VKSNVVVLVVWILGLGFGSVCLSVCLSPTPGRIRIQSNYSPCVLHFTIAPACDTSACSVRLFIYIYLYLYYKFIFIAGVSLPLPSPSLSLTHHAHKHVCSQPTHEYLPLLS